MLEWQARSVIVLGVVLFAIESVLLARSVGQRRLSTGVGWLEAMRSRAGSRP